MTYTSPNREVELIHLGMIDYQKAWDIQEETFKKVEAIKLKNRHQQHHDEVPNYLFTCQHPLVYTLGKSGSAENLLLDETGLQSIGASYYKVNRGGDITHHGPGQLVVYPVFDLENFFTDIHLYLRSLEEAVISTLSEIGIEAGRLEGYTGVWIEPDKPSARKICAMGVKCGRWITMHGLALNVNNNLDFFKHIVPCGIADKAVTSIAAEMPNAPVSIDSIEKLLLSKLQEEFQMHII